MSRGTTALGLGGMLAVLLTATGCIKVQMLVRLHEDGTGTVTEEVTFGEKLVNLTRRSKELPSIEQLTGEEAVRKRLAKMGKGVRIISRKAEPGIGGTARITVVYAFDDISELRTAAVPWGYGWDQYYLQWSLSADATLKNQYMLRARLANLSDQRLQSGRPKIDPLSELEAQQVRALLPVFRDLLDGFELSLRVEVFDFHQWAPATRGHGALMWGKFATSGGRALSYRLTDRDLQSSEDGLLWVVPWQQIGREEELFRLMPHVNEMFNDLRNQGFAYAWRVIQGPHGREYW